MLKYCLVNWHQQKVHRSSLPPAARWRNFQGRRQMSNNDNIDRMASAKAIAYTATNEPQLWSLPVTLHKSAGHKLPVTITINAVYQDTHPDGSAQRTVVSMHGSPGSHKDFKYITPLLSEKGVRMIGINWPGMGYSEYDNRLRNDNNERTQFVQAILDHLQVKRPLIFLGHSRGCENAFRLACRNEEKTVATIAANFVGFRAHKGIRPFWLVQLLSAIWEYGRWFQPLFAPIYQALYDWVGLKTANGYIVGRCLRTMCTIDLAAQRPFLLRLQQNAQIQLLLAYSGKDFLVENARSRDTIDAISECQELVTETKGEEDQVIADMRAIIRNGHQKHMVVHFLNEDHFLQKHRCKFLAESILELFDAADESAGRGVECGNGQNNAGTRQMRADYSFSKL